MTGPAAYERTSLTRTFTMTFVLAEPESMERGKYINRSYHRSGIRPGYWLPAVFRRVVAEGRWWARASDGPYVLVVAHGHSVTKAGTKGAEFTRTFHDREWDSSDRDSRTPGWARDIIDEAKREAIGWGWPLTIEERAANGS